MRTAAVVSAAVLGVLLSGSAFARERKAKPKPKKKITTCVRFSQIGDAEARTITFTIDNGCEQELSCSISWTVTCEREQTNDAESHDENALLGSGQDQSFHASAAVCGDDAYVISAPKWSCKTPSSDTASAKP